jgi:hypothetical protein
MAALRYFVGLLADHIHAAFRIAACDATALCIRRSCYFFLLSTLTINTLYLDGAVVQSLS